MLLHSSCSFCPTSPGVNHFIFLIGWAFVLQTCFYFMMHLAYSPSPLLPTPVLPFLLPSFHQHCTMVMPRPQYKQICLCPFSLAWRRPGRWTRPAWWNVLWTVSFLTGLRGQNVLKRVASQVCLCLIWHLINSQGVQNKTSLLV